MARTFGAKDTIKRHRRTRQEVAEEKIRLVEEKKANEERLHKQKIAENYCLIPRELINMAGITEQELVLFLKHKAVSRLEELFSE